MEERKIKVYDKEGNLLAVFSNKTPAHIGESEKELMISPTIDIVSNSTSTLTFQMFVSSKKWQQIKNPENIYKCDNGRVYTALNEQSIVYNGPVVNVTLVEIWYLLSKKYLQVHNVNTEVEALDDHTVKILPKTDKKYKLTVNGVQYDDSEVKDSRGVLMPRGSAGYALWGILKGTDWKLGVCDVLPDGFDAANDYGTFNVESDMKSALENIQFVQELYGGILDWDSENKIVNLRDERKEGTDFNEWKGYSIRKNKNLSEYPTITWDNNIITRLYPLGNGNLNIKKVNDNKGYVENFSYTKKVYEAYLQNSNIYHTNDEGGQKTLKYWAEQKLLDLCKPRKIIKYSVIDMRGTEDQWHEDFDINDIVKAYYQDTESGEEVYEFLRIQSLSYNYFFPGSDSTVEVGDKIQNEVELFYQIYKYTENSASTDYNGHLSGEDIYLEIPEVYWDDITGGYWGYGSLQTITNLHAEHETENTQAIADLSVYADETFATITSFTSFQEWTEDELKSSSTRIDQVSSALSAQIELEAQHYEETKTSIQESIASLKLYVDGDFASSVLSAAYSYADTEVNKVSNSLSSFEAYADRTYATTSQISQFITADEAGNLVSSSEASIKSYVSRNYASISIQATVNNLGSHFNVSTYSIYMYGSSGSSGGYVGLSSSATTIGGSSAYTNIYGRTISIYSSGSLSIQSKNASWKYSSTLGGYYLGV